MWRAWVGFNATHGFGLILFGALYGYLAIRSLPSWNRRQLSTVELQITAATQRADRQRNRQLDRSELPHHTGLLQLGLAEDFRIAVQGFALRRAKALSLPDRGKEQRHTAARAALD